MMPVRGWLAGAGLADQADDLAPVDRQIDAAQRDERRCAVACGS